MKLIGLLITFKLILNFVSSEEIECSYITHSDGYNCEMRSFFEENKEVSAVIGEHKSSKTNEDVDVFFVTDTSNTKYVPSKACSVFTNLNKFDIYGNNIVELKKPTFEGCTNLKKVVLKYLKLKTLEEDLLSDIPKLESFTLSLTSVEVLPKNLFANNPNLKFIDLSMNKLKTITTQFPDTTIMLSLINNVCIDGFFDSRSIVTSTTLLGLIQDIYKKCKSENTNSQMWPPSYSDVQMQLIEEQINKNENKLLALEADIENLESKIRKKIEESTNSLKIFKEETDEKMEKFNNNVEKIEGNSKVQDENYIKILNQLSDESNSLKVKLDRTEEINEANAKMELEIKQNENLILILFISQLFMVSLVIVFSIYKKCFFNQNRVGEILTRNLSRESM